MKTIAVVVVSYNSSAVLPGLLDSLDEGMDGTAWRLIVVDNASTDGSADIVGLLAPDATVIRSPGNDGYAAGINRGVRASGEVDAVLILNPDVRLGARCAIALAEALTPPVGMAAPFLEDAAGTMIPSIRREPTLGRAVADALVGAERAGRRRRWGEVATDPREYADQHVIDWAEGSTLMVSATCLSEVGPWDESFFLYSEEVDFALRARDAGFAVAFVPEARATHLEGGSSGSAALWALVVSNRWRLYRKRHGRVASTAFWGALVLREGSRAMVGGSVNRASLRYLVSPRRMRERPGPDSIRR
jgi:GT2 family glycosyltransferase